MTIRIGQGTDKTDALLPVGEQVQGGGISSRAT